MDEGLKKGWEQLEEGLTKAMGRLSDAIKKAEAEMPDAMRSTNAEALRVQAMLDRVVAKRRKKYVLGGVVVATVSGMGPATDLAGECRVAEGSNEAKLLAFYSGAVAFSPAGAP